MNTNRNAGFQPVSESELDAVCGGLGWACRLGKAAASLVVKPVRHLMKRFLKGGPQRARSNRMRNFNRKAGFKVID